MGEEVEWYGVTQQPERYCLVKIQHIDHSHNPPLYDLVEKDGSKTQKRVPEDQMKKKRHHLFG